MIVTRIGTSEITQMLALKFRNTDLERLGTVRNVRICSFVGDLNPLIEFSLKLKSVSPIFVSSNQTATFSELSELIRKAMTLNGKIIILDEKMAIKL